MLRTTDLESRVRKLELLFWIVGTVATTVAVIFGIAGFTIKATLDDVQQRLKTAQENAVNLQVEIARINDARQAALEDHKKNLDDVARQSVTNEMQQQFGTVKSWTEYIYIQAVKTKVSTYANPVPCSTIRT